MNSTENSGYNKLTLQQSNGRGRKIVTERFLSERCGKREREREREREKWKRRLSDFHGMCTYSSRDPSRVHDHHDGCLRNDE